MTTDNNKKTYDPVEVDEEFFAENYEEQERFYSELKKLPESIQGILFNPEISSIIEKASLIYHLDEQQTAATSRLIRQVLVADIFIGDLPDGLAVKLNLDMETAKEIATYLANQLFAPIKDDIKKVQAEKFPDRIQNQQPPPPAPPENKRQTSQNSGQTYLGEDLSETGGNIIDLRIK